MLEKFQNLNISTTILQALNTMGFEEPTPIQAEAIPVALQGQDMIGQAQTGTGKTAAFGIPVLEKILASSKTSNVQTIVLSPTRELAMQVAEELNHLAQYTSIQALPIYGGQDMERQLRRLRKHPQIIVATPGRLIDHMKRGTIHLDEISTIVLDEADEMLDMGFIDDIHTIMSATPETRQTLLFSATMPAPIQKLAQTFLKDPQIIRMKAKEVTMDLIEQSYIETPDRQKFDVLCRLLDLQEPDLAIIFVRTKRRVDELSEALKKRGYSSEGIHGDLTQAKRDSVIRQFREKTIDILVATDVAARGLDISGVTHVFNYDLPQDPESYVHRVGRTGRAGKTGEATTFVIPRELEHLRAIERLIKRHIVRHQAPTLAEALEGAQQTAIRNLIATVEEQSASAYRANAEELLSHYDSVALLSAAIKQLTKEPDLTPVKITEEAPLRIRRVDELSEALKKRGYSSEGIHGDLTQAKRDSVIRQFREKTIDILVATDVAARGLDISGVTHVFNYDLPQDPESYVHRVGRTGRAGKTGEATTFVIPRELEHLRAIERLIKRHIVRHQAPTLAEALEGAQQTAIRNLIATVEEQSASAYRANAEELLSHYDSVALLSAAIKQLTKEPDLTPVKITEEAPLRIRRAKRPTTKSRRRPPRTNGDKHNEKRESTPKNQKKRHFSPRGHNNETPAPRAKKKVGKTPNRSVFKPYFKD